MLKQLTAEFAKTLTRFRSTSTFQIQLVIWSKKFWLEIQRWGQILTICSIMSSLTMEARSQRRCLRLLWLVHPQQNTWETLCPMVTKYKTNRTMLRLPICPEDLNKLLQLTLWELKGQWAELDHSQLLIEWLALSRRQELPETSFLQIGLY
jgi:hypothetical protein